MNSEVGKTHRLLSFCAVYLLGVLSSEAVTGFNLTGVELITKRENAEGKGRVLHEGDSPTASHCILMCEAYSGCQAANYISAVNRCQLLLYGDTQISAGVTYLQRTFNANARDCEEISDSGVTSNGVYMIALSTTRHIAVYCEFDDEGAWTIVLRRLGDDLPFDKYAWIDYKTGFGKQHAAYYLGNDDLHDFTTKGDFNYTLRVDLSDNTGLSLHADYAYFAISGEDDKYRMMLGTYLASSTLGDKLDRNKGQQFSTRDQDNDDYNGGHCAQLNRGGWWYGACTHSLLMGGRNGIIWNDWPQTHYYFIYAAMKLKRLN